jgi:ArsR family transcriptional regulator
MEKIYMDLTRVLKAISDPKRLKIVSTLSHGELCATMIKDDFDVTQPTLSHDMKVLKEAGVISDRRDGKNIFYTVNYELLNRSLRYLDQIFQQKEDYTPHLSARLER